MRVSVKYMAQVRHAAGVAAEVVELSGGCSVQDLVVQLAQRRGDDLRRLLLSPAGNVQPTLLLFLGDEQVDSASPVTLRDGDVVTVLTPIAGGAG